MLDKNKLKVEVVIMLMKETDREYQALKQEYDEWLADYISEHTDPLTDEQTFETIRHDPSILLYAEFMDK
jgi:hypothetical protein